MNLTFEDSQEKTIFYLLVLFGLITFAINAVKIFLLQPTMQYILLTVEMLGGLLVLFVPFLFTRFTGLAFPKIVRLYYWFFIWLSVFLGTGLRLILIIPFWDKLLHTASPLLLVAVGYGIIGYYLQNVPIQSVSPWLFIIMGFAFAGVCGVFWEFWEFLCDSIGNMNLQRYMTESGIAYVGRAALMDTMGDLLTNTIGALLLSLYSITQRHRPDYFAHYAFKKISN